MIIEVCAGSLEDCLVAQRAGADRIELNQALHLGGLTPSLGLLRLAKAHVQLPIICMVRPRGAGFTYSEADKSVMRQDALLLLEEGADGLAMGALTETGDLDQIFIQEMIDLVHGFGREFVFHRAFDVARNYREIAEQLIQMGCDRILTSGQANKADQGLELLADLEKTYGQSIQFCIGSGVHAGNAQQLLTQTGMSQLHASFKSWASDPTTAGVGVDYSFAGPGLYDYVDEVKIIELKNILGGRVDG